MDINLGVVGEMKEMLGLREQYQNKTETTSGELNAVLLNRAQETLDTAVSHI